MTAIDPSVLSAARTAGAAIEALGAAWMLHPDQFARSVRAGFAHPFAGYFAGRAGVLGGVDAQIVAATLAVFEPAVAARMWDAGIKVHPAQEAARIYIEQAAEWASEHLADADGLDRFIALSERVIAAAPAAGLPLFAGWRALPRTEDPPGRALQNAVVLREFCGGVHLCALTVAGISAVEASLLNKGEEYCAFLGWTAPFPDVTDLRTAYDEVGRQTDRRVASLLAATLSVTEVDDFTRAATSLQTHVVTVRDD